MIKDSGGVLYEGGQVPNAFVNHFEKFLGNEEEMTLHPTPELFSHTLGDEAALHMIRPVLQDEIKNSMFSIGDNKAPGPDGYTSAFFKHAWCVIGDDVTRAIQDFFEKADRIKDYLGEIVSINQSAFIPGRKISDNILLTQELMHNYHKQVGPPRGRRGLRQGDPLSPYLFTLVMEILTLMLQQTVSIDTSFAFHNKCEKQKIVSLCFADDLFLFACGEVRSVNCIMESLSGFSKMSGLKLNISKSIVHFCNIPNHVKGAILNLMPFMEGRMQLVISVLSATHVYWASVFILPGRIIKELEATMRGFLWCQGPMQKGKAKVSWKAVCVPKKEGGLGIRRIRDMNNALMAANAWSVIVKRESLWVAWIHDHRLKERSFWDCRIPNNCSWSWRKIMQLRPLIQPYVWAKHGNGRQVSAWFDTWSGVGPQNKFLSYRTISNGGFSLNTKVKDISNDGGWTWPLAWYDLFPVLNNVPHHVLIDHVEDKFCWKLNDKLKDFSTTVVWQSLRTSEMEINWMNIVWFSQCIPKHAFLMWLIIRKKTPNARQNKRLGGG
ncbi:uncharacterized protein LOC110890459 [Helianthus annuus]|uniref:uncharacterized protein LOC110890459 n=1 Tax=Helianthus annuus TaxID=4232 RepID=UPI000B905903|nr:uncharacterized protein LOC110890459 [Helianthus annuus]